MHVVEGAVPRADWRGGFDAYMRVHSGLSDCVGNWQIMRLQCDNVDNKDVRTRPLARPLAMAALSVHPVP